ncbi:hypothetical protein EJD97_018618 [Solanum chilense]|uniref:Uncharacterized protein n=1 Tax=Solanum chilense TaxID=4083 RepID=A0A6N2B4Z6_SOLCI|nr:hypothetical protein EJD97_018618 [Solanum chilense]
MGSKIIVIKRKESVAQTMCADRCTFTVGNLSSEDSWALFKRHSLENRDHPALEEVGRKIGDECKGLPLALKIVAGTLRGKSKVDEWRDILSSEIWEQPSCLKGYAGVNQWHVLGIGSSLYLRIFQLKNVPS